MVPVADCVEIADALGVLEADVDRLVVADADTLVVRVEDTELLPLVVAVDVWVVDCVVTWQLWKSSAP